MKNQISTSYNYLFWGILLQLFTLNIFDIGGVPSGRILQFVGFIILCIGLYRLKDEGKEFKPAFIMTIVCAVLVAAITVLTAIAANQGGTITTESAASITYNNITLSHVANAISIVYIIVRLISFIYIVKGSIRMLKRYKRHETLINLGYKRRITIIISEVLQLVIALLAIYMVVETVRLLNIYESTGAVDMAIVTSIGSMTLLILIIAIACIVLQILFLYYIYRVRCAFDIYALERAKEAAESSVIDADITNVTIDEEEDKKKWDDEIK